MCIEPRRKQPMVHHSADSVDLAGVLEPTWQRGSNNEFARPFHTQPPNPLLSSSCSRDDAGPRQSELFFVALLYGVRKSLPRQNRRCAWGLEYPEERPGYGCSSGDFSKTCRISHAGSASPGMPPLHRGRGIGCCNHPGVSNSWRIVRHLAL